MRRTNALAAVIATVAFASFAADAWAYHHPRAGRFMQRDPAGYVDGMSLYAYGGANPAGGRDALGLAWSQTECENWFWFSGQPSWLGSHFGSKASLMSNFSVLASKYVLAQRALNAARTVGAAAGPGNQNADSMIRVATKILRRAEEPYLFWLFMRNHGCKCCYLRREVEDAVQAVDWKQGFKKVKWIAKIGHQLIKRLPKLLTGVKGVVPNPDITGALGKYRVALDGIRDFLPDMFLRRAERYGLLFPRECTPIKHGKRWRDVVDKLGSPKQ